MEKPNFTLTERNLCGNYHLPPIQKWSATGFISQNSKWIPNFSAKIKPLTSNKVFPLQAEALKVFEILKKDIEDSVECSIDEIKLLVVEPDASGFAIATTLNPD